jgi:hypothetical protein
MIAERVKRVLGGRWADRNNPMPWTDDSCRILWKRKRLAGLKLDIVCDFSDV